MGGTIKFNHLAFVIWSFIFVFVISLFVRVYELGESPRSVNWDEAALGYNAYALLKTGHDEFGKYFPLSLQSFDDYKPALYSYFAVLPISIFGLNDVSVRLPSAIFGALLCLLIINIASKITKNVKVGIMAGLLLAFEPWAIHFSRIAFEANIGMVLMFSGIASILTFTNPVIGIILGVLSMYAYHAQRMIALPIIFILIYAKNTKKNILFFVKIILLTVVLLLPLAINFLNQPITARFAATSIFKLSPFVPKESKGEYSESTALANQVLGRYLAYFSPANLFVRGSNEPVLRIPTSGLLNSVEFIFWLMGWLIFLKNWKKFKFLIPLLIIAPLSGVITWNWFSTVRTLALYPVFSIIIAMGMQKIKPVILLLLIPFWVYTVANEISYSPAENYGEFQPGFEESVPYVLTAGKNYGKIVVDSPQSAPYIFYDFYGMLDPNKFITQKTDQGSNAGTEQNYKMGNIEFRDIYFEKDRQNPNLLIVGTAVSIKDGTSKIKEFFDAKGYITVRVYESQAGNQRSP